MGLWIALMKPVLDIVAPVHPAVPVVVFGHNPTALGRVVLPGVRKDLPPSSPGPNAPS